MTRDPIPTDKFDLAAIDHARSLGFPALNDHIPALLQWLQDPNWPVFANTAELLADAGPALLPHIRAVFAGDDSEWTWALLSGLCPLLPDEVLVRLSPDIDALAARYRDHDIHNVIKSLPLT